MLRLYEFREFFEETKQLPITSEEELRKELEADANAMKYNKANYSTPEDYEAYWEEKEELYKRYKEYGAGLMSDEDIKFATRRAYNETLLKEKNEDIKKFLKTKLEEHIRAIS